MLRTLQLNNLQLDNSSKIITSKNYFNHYFTNYPIKILHCHSFTIYFKTTTSVKNYKNYFIILLHNNYSTKNISLPIIYKTDSRLTTQPRNTFSLHKTYYTQYTVHIIHSSLQHLLSQHLYFLAICRRLKLIKTPQLTRTRINLILPTGIKINLNSPVFQSQKQL